MVTNGVGHHWGLQPCISALRLPWQSTRDWVASTTDSNCHTAHPKWRCWQGWFLPRTVGKASVPGLSPWFVDGCLLPVSPWHLPSMRVYVCVQNSVWDLTRSTINIPIPSSILFMMVCVCSKTIETALQLFPSWALTQTTFTPIFPQMISSRQSRLFLSCALNLSISLPLPHSKATFTF